MNSQSKAIVLLGLVAVLGVLLGFYFWPDNSPEPQKSVGEVKAGKTVRVIKLDGNYALVEKRGGQRGYVPTSKLIKPSEVNNPSPNEDVRVLSDESKLFESRPVALQPASTARSMKKIDEETRKLNRIYLSERTKKRILAPMVPAIFTDPSTGERCYPAITCKSRSCPEKRSEGEEPFLFLNKSRGTLAKCPACGEIGDPYVPPETVRRLKELEEEQKRLIQERKARRAKYGPMMKKRKLQEQG